MLTDFFGSCYGADLSVAGIRDYALWLKLLMSM